jgi:hypothetical protein
VPELLDRHAALAPPDLAPVPAASRLEQAGLVVRLVLDLVGGWIHLLLFPLVSGGVRRRFRQALTEDVS